MVANAYRGELLGLMAVHLLLLAVETVSLRITMYTQVHEEESSPLLCGFTATLFGSMPLAYEDSVKVKMV